MRQEITTSSKGSSCPFITTRLAFKSSNLFKNVTFKILLMICNMLKLYQLKSGKIIGDYGFRSIFCFLSSAREVLSGLILL